MYQLSAFNKTKKDSITAIFKRVRKGRKREKEKGAGCSGVREKDRKKERKNKQIGRKRKEGRKKQIGEKERSRTCSDKKDKGGERRKKKNEEKKTHIYML